MPATLVISLDANLHGGSPLQEGRSVKEYVKVQGATSAAADTGAYTMRWARKNPRPVGWPGGYSYNSTTFVMTLTAILALADAAINIYFIDDNGPQ